MKGIVLNTEKQLAIANRRIELLEGMIDGRTRDLLSQHDELKTAHTELNDQYRQLVHAGKMASLGQMAAGIAHEINNPLGYVLGNLHVLSQYLEPLPALLKCIQEEQEYLRTLPETKAREFARRIGAMAAVENLDYVSKDLPLLIRETTEGAERVRDIVARLRVFSRFDQGINESVCINDCLDHSIKLVWNELKYKCNVIRDFTEILAVAGCHGELSQVFMNLLVNAAQAIDGHGNVTVRSFLENGKVAVTITDTGRGMAPEELAKLFTPFFTTKPVGSGTGLGLSVSYGIVQKHGGDILVTSRVGAGSVFKVLLPLLKAPGSSPRESSDGEDMPQKKPKPAEKSGVAVCAGEVACDAI